MDYVKEKIQLLANHFVAQIKKTKPVPKINSTNPYFKQIFKILSWDDLNLTLIIFLVFNFLFWLTVRLELKFLGVIFLIALSIFFYDSVLDKRELLECEEKYGEAAEKFLHILQMIAISLYCLRKENPSSFCFAMTLFFLVLSFVAKSFSGYILAYLCFLGIFFVPLGLSKLSPEFKKGIEQAFTSIATNKDVIAEEELFPYLMNSGGGDNDGDLDSLLTDGAADSISNSLISGISIMPSYMDADDNTELLEEDLIPLRSSPGMSFPVADQSSDSDDSVAKGIRFESSHFNGDSSEEENKFAEGLHFTENSQDSLDSNNTDQNSQARLFTKYLVETGAAGLSNLMNTAIQTVSGITRRKNSNSDSDFEIIDSADLDHTD